MNLLTSDALAMQLQPGDIITLGASEYFYKVREIVKSETVSAASIDGPFVDKDCTKRPGWWKAGDCDEMGRELQRGNARA